MKDKAALWLEYANVDPEGFERYRAWCECPDCRDYRNAANKWIEDQLAKDGKEESGGRVLP